MAKINLLPWREELRAQKKTGFYQCNGSGNFSYCHYFWRRSYVY